MSETYAICKKCKLSKFHIKIKIETERQNSVKPNASNPTPVQITKKTQHITIECDNCRTLYMGLAQEV